MGDDAVLAPCIRSAGTLHARRRGGDQHLARGRAGLAQIVLRGADRAAAAGRHVAPDAVAAQIFLGLRRIRRLHLVPVAAELLGDQHGQRREDALAHLGAGDPDGHAVVGRDHDPGGDLRCAVARRAPPCRTGCRSRASARRRPRRRSPGRRGDRPSAPAHALGRMITISRRKPRPHVIGYGRPASDTGMRQFCRRICQAECAADRAARTPRPRTADRPRRAPAPPRSRMSRSVAADGGAVCGTVGGPVECRSRCARSPRRPCGPDARCRAGTAAASCRSRTRSGW